MSSSNVADYLNQLGSNERQLQYCRQILAGNPNFIPQKIFTINFSHHKHSLSQKQFAQMMQSIEVACNDQEINLIFSYFQIDGKDYISCEEFVSTIIPQIDPSLINLLNNRKQTDFHLDYSLRYALQKYFMQVVQNQVALELKCNFGFELDPRQNHKNKRLQSSMLEQFMHVQGKYPSETILQFILRELRKNKGNKRRHQLITEYILEYLSKKRQQKDLPKVVVKVEEKSVNLPLSRKKMSVTTQKVDTDKIKPSLVVKKKSSSNSSDINWSSFSPVKTRKQKPQKITPAQSLVDVEKRIKQLMGQVVSQQEVILNKSKLNNKSALSERSSNLFSTNGKYSNKVEPWKDKSSQRKSSFNDNNYVQSVSNSQVQMNFSSISVPTCKRSIVSDQSDRSVQRQKVRKRFNLTQNGSQKERKTITQKGKSPLKSRRKQTSIEFGKIVEQSKEYYEQSRANERSQRQAEKKRERSNSRNPVDLSIYTKYNYLPEQKSREKMKDRIAFLKKLVGSKE